MDHLLFFLMVAVLAILLIASAVAAHVRIGRRTAGWWTGIVLALILLGAASDQFDPLPTRHGVACENPEVADWDAVMAQAVRVDWLGLAAGATLGFLAIEILSRIDLPEKVLALILLGAALCLSFTIVYVFAIRKLSYLVFSTTMGALVGILGDFAFFGDWSRFRGKNTTAHRERSRQ